MVTVDECLPAIEISDSHPSSIGTDFAWLTKVINFRDARKRMGGVIQNPLATAEGDIPKLNACLLRVDVTSFIIEVVIDGMYRKHVSPYYRLPWKYSYVLYRGGTSEF